LEVVDPDLRHLPILESVGGFQLRTESFPGALRLNRTRQTATSLRASALASVSTDDLWRAHASPVDKPLREGIASRMALKIELARRSLQACDLCAWRCGVDRLAGERGRCQLDDRAYVAEAFVHIAEEPPINPILNIALQGCGLRCRYCQQYRLLAIRPWQGVELTPDFWSAVTPEEWDAARAVGFVGGNPDESLPAILGFLNAAPDGFSLPVVWNCHGYATPTTLALLEGVMDCWVPDLKYGNDACAREWSGIPNYVATMRENVEGMVATGAEVFCRLLVLPSHNECCHFAALDWLAESRHRIRLNVMGQYAPDNLTRTNAGDLSRRPTPREVREVRQYAEQLGFRFV